MGKRIELEKVYRAKATAVAPEAERPLSSGPPVVGKRRKGKAPSVSDVAAESIPVVAGVDGPVRSKGGFVLIKRDRTKWNAYMRDYRRRKKAVVVKE